MWNIGEKIVKQKRIIEYDILRVIITILVIIGHYTYYVIDSPYGGCDYSSFTKPKMSVIYQLAINITSLIYRFHMQLYMALSGALFNFGGGIKLIESYYL